MNLGKTLLLSPTSKRVANAVLFAFVAWSATRVYAVYCAPAGLYGFLQSFITMDSTLCKVVFAIISHTQILYGAAVASLFYAFVNLFRSGSTQVQRRVSDSDHEVRH